MSSPLGHKTDITGNKIGVRSLRTWLQDARQTRCKGTTPELVQWQSTGPTPYEIEVAHRSWLCRQALCSVLNNQHSCDGNRGLNLPNQHLAELQAWNGSPLLIAGWWSLWNELPAKIPEWFFRLNHTLYFTYFAYFALWVCILYIICMLYTPGYGAYEALFLFGPPIIILLSHNTQGIKLS